MNRLLFGDNLNWLRNKEILPDVGCPHYGMKIAQPFMAG